MESIYTPEMLGKYVLISLAGILFMNLKLVMIVATISLALYTIATMGPVVYGKMRD
jgi:hypothetical protein